MMPSSLEVIFLCLCSLGVVLGGPFAVTAYKPVEVTLYYETLCPDCQQFIPDKLFSTYMDRKFDFASLFANLTLIPYGFVSVIDPSKHKYRCQHLQSECDGNRLHGCAMKYIADTSTLLGYISCLEKSVDLAVNQVNYPTDKCQDKVPEGLYSKIIDCYSTEEGWELFERNGNATNNFFSDKKSAFVPYVSFNNKKNDALAEMAVDDFRKTICLVAGVKDRACSDSNAH